MAISICGTVGGNTGEIQCDIFRGLPKQLILGGATFTSSDWTTIAVFEAAFKAKLKLAKGSSSKLFPTPAIVGAADKTTAAKTATLGYGTPVKLLDSLWGAEFDVLAGTTLEKELKKFDGQLLSAFILDDQGRIWGKYVNGVFSGVQYLVTMEAAGFKDGQNAKVTKISVSILDSSDFITNAMCIDTNLSTSSLTGLVDVVLTESSAHTANVFHIDANVLTTDLLTKISMKTLFGALLANVARWSVVDAAGAAVTITSVAQVGTGYDLTMDSTAYAALATGGKWYVSLAAPSVLDAAGVTGVETAAALEVVK